MPTEFPNDHEQHESEVTLEHGITLSESKGQDYAQVNLNDDHHFEEGDKAHETNIDTHESHEHETDAYESHIDQDSNVETITPEDLHPAHFDEEDDFDVKDDTKTIEQEPEYTAVDIKILNKTYTINCPVGEETELLDASTFINTFIDDLRSQAPDLGHENLLVLCCLNLYEQLQQSKNQTSKKAHSIEHANQLIDQMIQDMQLVQQ